MEGKNGIFDDLWGSEGLPASSRGDYDLAAKNTSDGSYYAAIVNSMLNRPDESNPYGSRQWKITGYRDDGAGHIVPQFSSETTMSPEQQRLYEQQTGAQTQFGRGMMPAAQAAVNNAGTGIDFGSMPKMYGAGDLEGTRNTVSKAMYDRSMRLLEPQFTRQNDQTRSDLVSRGFSLGDKGYENELDRIGRSQDEQRLQAADAAVGMGGAEESRLVGLSGDVRNQAITEAMTNRNLPFQDYAAFSGGSAPIAPNFQPFFTGAGMQGADYLGALSAQERAALTGYGLETKRAEAEHQGGMDVWKGFSGGGTGGQK